MFINNRTFIISGGISGLGLAAALSLVSAGAHVALFDRNSDLGQDVLKSHFNSKPVARFYAVDVTDYNDLESAVDHVVAWASDSNFPLGGVVFLDINLTGTYSLATLVASRLARSPALPSEPDAERGVIILVSSVAGLEGQLGQTAYAASKGAIASLALPLARDLARWGIRVNALAPAVFETAMSAYMPEKTRQKLYSQLEFPKRFGKAEEFAEMALSLIRNGIVNGTIVRLDGATRMGKL
ncbi:3-hydroxyacyl-CoA dehydrogenase type-2 [Myxozyma melibiosi]|uniref:3-hydroxyacyl-CoA dehydrogenase type-2 n=1 Tax=Myxozyma melibiosi TaxID=54550 RepID=A0ABR1FBK8_9ASCO